MNKEELIEETLNIPKKIYDEELKLIEVFDNFNKLNETITLMELKIKNNVIAEVDDKGKQLHTNETMREVRFYALSLKDTTFQKLKEDKLNLQKEINKQKAFVEFLKNDFSANKTVLKVFEESE